MSVSAAVAEQLSSKGGCDSGRSIDPKDNLSEQLLSDDTHHVLLCLASPGSWETYNKILICTVLNIQGTAVTDKSCSA
jgi:hypothetical protein